jgi:hypothetical protein
MAGTSDIFVNENENENENYWLSFTRTRTKKNEISRTVLIPFSFLKSHCIPKRAQRLQSPTLYVVLRYVAAALLRWHHYAASQGAYSV